MRLPLVLTVLLSIACGRPGAPGRERITPEYDKKSGKLQLLKYDSNNDGQVDMWSYMDGARVVRVEIDKDGDGKIDRWEHYDANQKIVKIGFSRQHDGKEDAWSYSNAAGEIERIEVSTKRDGVVSRVERYVHGALATAEEDTDGDGRLDTWETYDGERLAMIAYDTAHRGSPDRRLVYAPDGTTRVEIDPGGTGRFVPAPAAPPR